MPSVQRPRFALRKAQIASERPNCFGLFVNWVCSFWSNISRERQEPERMEPEKKRSEKRVQRNEIKREMDRA